MKPEKWKTIEAFGRRYRISTHGRIWTRSRYVQCGHKNSKPQWKPGKFLSPVPDARGYLYVCLRGPDGHQHKKIHRLVAETFVPNPLGKPEVNHRDGIKQNNHATNLEWATTLENSNHAWRSGLYANISKKITREQLPIVRKRLDAGERPCKLAREYNVSPGYISNIKNGRRRASES